MIFMAVPSVAALACCVPNHVRVDPTEDLQLLYSILQTEGVAEWVGEDGAELILPSHPKIHYLLAKIEIGVDGVIEDRVIGCVAFMPINAVTWNPHIAILPKYHGNGTDAMRAGIQWIFGNTDCEKLVAHPPEYNKPMVRVFEKCGFDHEGFSPQSVRKNGVLHGRHLMGRVR